MIISGRRASVLLFLGDIVAFVVSLYLTLWLRFTVVPDAKTLAPYLVPFSLLFLLWVLVFYSAGLYSKQLALFPSRLPDALLGTQITNIIFAALFFFFIPAFGITPKTILALYLTISLALIFFWRLVLYPRFSLRHSRERVMLIAFGTEADELHFEVNRNPRYGIEFVSRPDTSVIADPKVLRSEIEHARTHILVFDAASADTAHVDALIHTLGRRYQFVTFEDLYQEVFDRIPLSQLGHAWFLKHVALEDPVFYRVTKRVVDIIGGILMAIITVCITPFIFVLNLFESKGPLFIKQERFGKYGAPITVFKFRSMEKNLSASSEWTHEGENRITKVGGFLRQTSLDEFPQCLNIIRGELSLIGPRSDILGLGQRLAEALPYYEARYLVVPGITGWAQINQQYEPGNTSPQSIEETRVRLAYDFYYLAHRSFGLDIVIALKTVKRMFFRASSW
jgi:lipopolysaccharide/colanic/teichoic acid biosynthesis glycosyltransferase